MYEDIFPTKRILLHFHHKIMFLLLKCILIFS